MNWTEGNLARHSRGRRRNQLLIRQKQYFAKARNNSLSNSVKQSPIAVSFLSPEHTGDLRRHLARRPSSPLGHNHRHRNSHLDTENAPRSKTHVYGYGSKHGEKQFSSGTTMHLGERKRPRDSEDVDTDDAHSVILHEKKRRLLAKADWAGLNMQQPPRITFPGQWNCDDDFKWSKAFQNKTNKPSKSRHSASASRIGDAMQISYYGPSPSAQHGQRIRPRIQIGSQEIQFSAGTTSQASRKQCSSAARTVHSSSARLSIPIPTQARQSFASRTDHDLADENKHDSSSPDHPKVGYMGQKINHSLDATIESIQGEAQLPKIVYSSSLIHEPVPRRANDFIVLQWSPSVSEKAESLQVQVGGAEPTVRKSQRVDNRNWKKFLTSSDQGSGSITQETLFNASPIQPNSSSGASALLSQSEVDLDSIPERNSPRLSSPPMTSREFSGSTSSAHTLDRSSNTPPPLLHSIRSTKDDAVSNKDVTRNAIAEHQHIVPAAPARDAPAQTTDEEQRSWMKFVFDFDEDELRDRAFQDARQQAAYEIKPSNDSSSGDDLSMVNNYATDEATPPDDEIKDIETIATCGTAHSELYTRVSDGISSPRTSDESHNATQGTIPSDSGNGSSRATNGMGSVRPSQLQTIGNGFRFAAPKSFIGKFVGSKDRMKTQPSFTPYTKASRAKGRGRRKTRGLDGRPNIRELPDFDDDPIEASDE